MIVPLSVSKNISSHTRCTVRIFLPRAYRHVLSDALCLPSILTRECRCTLNAPFSYRRTQSLRLINPLISHAFLVFRLAFAPNARACLSASPNVSITGPLVRLTSSFARFTRTLVERDRFPSTVSLEQLLFVTRYTPHRKNESSLFLLSFSFSLSPFLFLFLSQVTCTCELDRKSVV